MNNGIMDLGEPDCVVKELSLPTDEEVNVLLDEVAEIIRTEFVDCAIDGSESHESLNLYAKEGVEKGSANRRIKKEPVKVVNACLKQGSESGVPESKCPKGGVFSELHFSQSDIQTKQIYVEFGAQQKQILVHKGNNETLEDVFKEFLRNEPTYSEYMKDKIVFQYFDKVHNHWIDIDDSCTLYDGAYVRALLHPKQIGPEVNRSVIGSLHEADKLELSSAASDVPCIENYENYLKNQELEERSVTRGESKDIIGADVPLSAVISENEHSEIDKKVSYIKDNSINTSGMVIDSGSEIGEITTLPSESTEDFEFMNESSLESDISGIIIDPTSKPYEISHESTFLLKTNKDANTKVKLGNLSAKEDRDFNEENTMKHNVEDIHVKESAAEKLTNCNEKTASCKDTRKIRTYKKNRPKSFHPLQSGNQRIRPLLPTPWNNRLSWEQKHREKVQVLWEHYRSILQLQQWQQQQQVLQQIQLQQLQSYGQHRNQPLLPTPLFHNGTRPRGSFPWK